jgi:16S rRNA (guanine(1405)-N(7))-methyltransferase
LALITDVISNIISLWLKLKIYRPKKGRGNILMTNDSDIEKQIEIMVKSIKASKKYRCTNIETIRQLVKSEWGHHKTGKITEKAVRKRLHNIMAPFLGDPDYDSAASDLTCAFQSGNQEAVKETCKRIMACHLSTRERLSILENFYTKIFSVTGQPHSILDIACSLNPLSFPWMGLPNNIEYYAYDIHEKRINFINTYFSLQGLPTLARVQDMSFYFPRETADVALFLKELPRFERNYGKISLDLLDALRVRYIVVSFPTYSIRGNRVLTKHYRDFFYRLISGKGWSVTEIEFESELIFCVDKPITS